VLRFGTPSACCQSQEGSSKEQRQSDGKPSQFAKNESAGLDVCSRNERSRHRSGRILTIRPLHWNDYPAFHSNFCILLQNGFCQSAGERTYNFVFCAENARDDDDDRLDVMPPEVRALAWSCIDGARCIGTIGQQRRPYLPLKGSPSHSSPEPNREKEGTADTVAGSLSIQTT
jgi:hypothetical protein